MSHKSDNACVCPKIKCERHGKCSECIEHHKTSKYKVYCRRSPKKTLLEKIFKNIGGSK